MPPGVTVDRSGPMGRPCSSVWYSDSACRQRRVPAHVGDVERHALVEGGLGRVAHEGRRHEVALAVPERDHVAQLPGAHREVGDVFGREILDLRAGVTQGVFGQGVSQQRGHGSVRLCAAGGSTTAATSAEPGLSIRAGSGRRWRQRARDFEYRIL